MIASLMMYARPELDQAHEHFWALIRDELALRGKDSPETLDQDAPELDVWTDPHLVLSQTCGMPYRLWLHDKVTLVGTPDYGIDGCPPGYYRSPIIVRHDDPRQSLRDFSTAIFAFNAAHSQSGYAAAFAQTTKAGFWFDSVLETGAHSASAWAVAEGNADIAALDAMTWKLIQAYDDVAQKLRVLEWTEPTPGLPLITAASNDAPLVFDAVDRAISRLDTNIRGLLGLRGLVRIPKAAYLEVANPR